MTGKHVRLREVAVGVFNDPDIAVRVNRLFGPPCQAIDIHLDRSKLLAPFAKLVVETGDRLGRSDVHAIVATGVADALVPYPVQQLAGRPTNETRSATAHLINTSLDEVRRQIEWDDAPLREIVDQVGSHRGPYRFAGRRRLRDTTRRRHYVTVYEFDERGARVDLEVHDAALGEMYSIQVAKTSAFRPFSSFFPSRTIRLSAGSIEYLTSDKTVLASVDPEARLVRIEL